MDAIANIIVIGGSAGSLPVVLSILNKLPPHFAIPVIIVLHRQRNVKSEMLHILSDSGMHKIVEPDDKDLIESGHIYLAPQNYHLLVEADKTISLDYSEVVRYSRPSIDVTFESAAIAFGKGVTGILLSGANHDGAAGVKAILDNGGKVLVQDPSTAEYPVMPKAAAAISNKVLVRSPEGIINYLLTQ